MTFDGGELTSVAEALSRHYDEHGLPPDGGEQADWFYVRLGPFVLPLPNPPARKRAVLFHDVNHVVTGYNTVFSDGEMVIAGYELGNGCGRFWIAWLINLGAFALGLIVCPRRMFRAFLRGRRASSVYRWEDRVALRAMTVPDLKVALGVPDDVPPARLSDRTLFLVWALAAQALALSPVLLGVGTWWVLRGL